MSDIDLNGMCVLQVLPALEAGGVERGTIDVAIAILKAGGRAVVASSGGAMVRELDRHGITHVTLPLASKAPPQLRRNTNALAALIRDHQVDVVHARSRAPAWSARAAARRTRRAFVTTFHGTYNFSPGLGGALKKRYNAIMTRGERVIAISEFIAGHIRTHYRTDPERIRVIHRGVDIAMYDPSAVPAPRIVKLAEDWRLPDGVPVILMPGRLTRWKGQLVFLEALAQLERDDFVAVVVGSAQGRDNYAAELQKLADSHGLHAVLRFADHCNDMPAAFMLADLVVSASTDPEAFGRVVVEAQAMGRPVIATGHGGPKETVIEGKTGWLTPPGDAAALAEAIGRALDLDDEARAEMASAGRRNVAENFTKDLMCLRTLEVYQEVAVVKGQL